MRLDQATINDLNGDLLTITRSSIAAADLLQEGRGGPELADQLVALTRAYASFSQRMKLLIILGNI